MPFRTKRK